MTLKEAIEKRRSVRLFSPEPVPEEIIRELVRLAGLAPSINNSQNWKFTAISNKETLGKMRDSVAAKYDSIFSTLDEENKIVLRTVEKFSTFFVNAPLLIAISIKPYEAVIDRILPDAGLNSESINKIRNHPEIQSVGAAIQNMLLAATSLEYAGCWLTGLLIARKEIESLLGISDPYKLAACVALGKPAEIPKNREKLPVDKILDIVK
ncbi:MAG: nitroreductase family protein [Ignavibacteriaceae bacterium]|nr:nitroreductase family protein [Ignavibacteriaceae bacterium]